MLVKSKIVYELMDLYKRVNSLSIKQRPCCGQVSCVTCMWVIVATLCYKCIHTKVVHVLRKVSKTHSAAADRETHTQNTHPKRICNRPLNKTLFLLKSA
jgi:hypothetical protein